MATVSERPHLSHLTSGRRSLVAPGLPSPATVAGVILALVIAAPILALIGFLWQPDMGLLRHLARTVLTEYLVSSAALALGVGGIAAAIGAGTAWLVTMYRFPGRRLLDWALVLPLAMPAYVLAYAYTDLLQVTGSVQTTLRALTGWGVQDYWFPRIHSLGGAIFVISFVLYPYVYILARASFLEQSVCALEVGRTLGCGAFASFRRVGLPLARPAIVAGAAFVVMETLADFGTVAYFEVRTLTTGIYRSWYALGSPAAAAQLACLLLAMIALVIMIERRSRGHARFASDTAHTRSKQPVPLDGWRGRAAAAACALPVLLGFALPAGILTSMSLETGAANGAARLVELLGNTAVLATLAGVAIVAVAVLGLLFLGRDAPRAARRLGRGATLGYAVPGAVIGVGILIVIGSLDDLLDRLGVGLFLSGSLAALVYGYLVRFYAVAYNPLEAGLAKITVGTEDAARILGCNRAGVLSRVQLPLLRSSLLAALLLVLVDVTKELPATYILRPFDFDTLAVEAFQLATTERLDAAALPSLLICLVGLVPTIMLCRMLARGRTPALDRR